MVFIRILQRLKVFTFVHFGLILTKISGRSGSVTTTTT